MWSNEPRSLPDWIEEAYDILVSGRLLRQRGSPTTEPTTCYWPTRHSRTRLPTPSMLSNACSIPVGCTKSMANSESPIQRPNRPTTVRRILLEASMLITSLRDDQEHRTYRGVISCSPPETGTGPFTLWGCTLPLQLSCLCVGPDREPSLGAEYGR